MRLPSSPRFGLSSPRCSSLRPCTEEPPGLYSLEEGLDAHLPYLLGRGVMKDRRQRKGRVPLFPIKPCRFRIQDSVTAEATLLNFPFKSRWCSRLQPPPRPRGSASSSGRRSSGTSLSAGRPGAHCPAFLPPGGSYGVDESYHAA